MIAERTIKPVTFEDAFEILYSVASHAYGELPRPEGSLTDEHIGINAPKEVMDAFMEAHVALTRANVDELAHGRFFLKAAGAIVLKSEEGPAAVAAEIADMGRSSLPN